MKKICIGVLGLGVVGTEVVNIYNRNKDSYKNIIIKYAFVRDTKKERGCDLEDIKLTDDVNEILNDPEVNVIIECMGGSGTENTYRYLVDAMSLRKHVVMSSKKVLALYGMELVSLANENKVYLRYDATVGGGIPIAKVIDQCFIGDRINKVIGILNATSNFICTKMEKEQLDYLDALKIAQDLGYAENDPTEDVGGFDAMYKSIVLAMFSMGIFVDKEYIETQSLKELRKTDIMYARELGYSIKPIAVFERVNDTITYRIGPCLVEQNHIVANTFNNNGVVVLCGEESGEFAFYGQGAGSKPTANAMFDDLMWIEKRNRIGEYITDIDKIRDIKKVENIELYRHHLYIRIVVENEIGRLANITSILSKLRINVDKIIQKDMDGDKMGIVFLTSLVDNKTIQKLHKEFDDINVEIRAIIPFLN